MDRLCSPQHRIAVRSMLPLVSVGAGFEAARDPLPRRAAPRRAAPTE